VSEIPRGGMGELLTPESSSIFPTQGKYYIPDTTNWLRLEHEDFDSDENN
jgi:hypothetical protein